MLKKYFSLALAALLVHAAQAVPARAQPPGNAAPSAEGVREKILSLGTGQAARVRIELRDKTRLDGYVSRAGADSFVVTDRTGRETTVAYAQVKRAWGSNYLTDVSIRVGTGKPKAFVLGALSAAMLVFTGIYIIKTGGF